MVREDDLRATFSALHAEEAPPRAVTAADLIQRGQAVRSRRRTIAVVGSGLATVGVVAVALAVLPAATPPEPARPVPPASTTSQVPSTTEPQPTSIESTPTTVLPTGAPRSSAPPVPEMPTVGSSQPGTSSMLETMPPTKPSPPTSADLPVSTTPSTTS